MNPGSPAPQASVLIRNSRENHLDTGDFPSRLRARNKGKFTKEISFIPPKTEETIINTLIALKGEGITENVLKTIIYKLKQIARNCDLSDQQAVKNYIANAKNRKTGKPLASGSKNKFLFAYDKFCKVRQIEWKRPYYKVAENVPLVPTTENINAIINNASEHYAVVFNILKETGASGKELENVTHKDIDLDQRIIRIHGVKGHASGTYKLKKRTSEMLREYLAKNPQEYPFPHLKVMSDAWRTARGRLADKLKQPDLNQIPMNNLRNYSGAKESTRC